jgi:hypothetical protein
MALESSVLSTEEFRGFAKDCVLFCHVTTHLDGMRYDGLLLEKGGSGWPHVVAMDAEGEVVAELQRRERSVEGFRGLMKGSAEFVSLRSRKDRSPTEEARFLGLEIRMRKVKAEDARARAATLKGLDDASRKELDGLLLALDFATRLEHINWGSPEARASWGMTLADRWKAGQEPSCDDDRFETFYILILDYAEYAKDTVLFEKALGKLRERPGSTPEIEPYFRAQDERLAKLKKEGPPEGAGEDKK